jgi:hypothetical protein
MNNGKKTSQSAHNLKGSIEAVEMEVSNSLSHLEKIGVLQPCNQMNLNEFLTQ